MRKTKHPTPPQGQTPSASIVWVKAVASVFDLIIRTANEQDADVQQKRACAVSQLVSALAHFNVGQADDR